MTAIKLAAIDMKTNTRSAWKLTTKDQEAITAHAREDKSSVTSAARMLGIDRNTLVRAAAKAGKEEWLLKQFSMQSNIPLNKRKTIPAAQQERVKRALTMAWR